MIREYVTINPGTAGGGSKTTVGNNCLFMISSHIAHDCNIGNNVIIANNVPIGGHVTIEDSVVIGGNSATTIHKNWKIGNDWRNDRCFKRRNSFWFINRK